MRYREAVIRYLPDVLFTVLGSLGLAASALGMADDEYFSRSWFALQEQLKLSAPRWNPWVDIMEQVWTWSEVVVLLTNRKRRALHDFLAGTIVIVVRHEEKSAAATASPTAAA